MWFLFPRAYLLTAVNKEMLECMLPLTGCTLNSQSLKFINVNFLWMSVNKLKVLILHQRPFLFFPQINSPSNSS